MSKPYIKGIFLFGCCLFSMATYAGPNPEDKSDTSIHQVMQIQEAYDAIPHKRVTFDPKNASMPAQEANYLYQFFSLVDLAVVERVETLSWFMHKKGADNQNSAVIIRQMESLAVPQKLKTQHDLVVSAVEEQKRFFDAWRQNPQMRFSARDPRIISISDKLKKAYQLYMNVYPDESSHNKEAFYQHLCALDNI